MNKVDVVMPQLGESVAEGTILKWHKKVGDQIQKDEVLYEVSTDKIDTEIPSPVSGVLKEILVEEGKTVDVSTVVARIESATAAKAGVADSIGTKTEPKPHMGGESGKQETRVISRQRQPQGMSSAAPSLGRKLFLSPVVRKMIKEHKMSEAALHTLSGSGAGGRITRRDVEAYISGSVKKSDTLPSVTLKSDIQKMSNMRKKIAEHMIFSRQTSAHCQMFHEADVTDMMLYQKAHADEFASQGVKLTVTPLFIHPLMKAIRAFPIFNASVQGDEIHFHEHINVAVAVAIEKGLIVPVIKQAENLNLLGLAKAVQDLAMRARNNQLNVDDLQGGTFTITNPGMYGTLFSAPIINQPQVAIFSPGAIQKRVVVRKDNSLAIRDRVYLSLSFDHRVIDGAVAGDFLRTFTHHLEQSFSAE